MTIEEFKAGNKRANALNVKIQQAQGALEENKRQFEKLCAEFEAEYHVKVTAENLDSLLASTLAEVTALAEEQKKAIEDAEKSIYIEAGTAPAPVEQAQVPVEQAQASTVPSQSSVTPATANTAFGNSVATQAQVPVTPVAPAPVPPQQPTYTAPTGTAQPQAVFGATPARVTPSPEALQQAQLAQNPELTMPNISADIPAIKPSIQDGTSVVDFDKILGGKFGG